MFARLRINAHIQFLVGMFIGGKIRTDEYLLEVRERIGYCAFTSKLTMLLTNALLKYTCGIKSRIYFCDLCYNKNFESYF